MKPFLLRFFMIASLLVSMQASASMAVTMVMTGMARVDSASTQPVVSAHCADMPGMEKHPDKTGKTPTPEQHCERCNTSCCTGFVSISASSSVPIIKYQQDYQETPVLLPSRLARVNDRPPISS